MSVELFNTPVEAVCIPLLPAKTPKSSPNKCPWCATKRNKYGFSEPPWNIDLCHVLEMNSVPARSRAITSSGASRPSKHGEKGLITKYCNTQNVSILILMNPAIAPRRRAWESHRFVNLRSVFSLTSPALRGTDWHQGRRKRDPMLPTSLRRPRPWRWWRSAGKPPSLATWPRLHALAWCHSSLCPSSAPYLRCCDEYRSQSRWLGLRENRETRRLFKIWREAKPLWKLLRYHSSDIWVVFYLLLLSICYVILMICGIFLVSY